MRGLSFVSFVTDRFAGVSPLETDQAIMLVYILVVSTALVTKQRSTYFPDVFHRRNSFNSSLVMLIVIPADWTVTVKPAFVAFLTVSLFASLEERYVLVTDVCIFSVMVREVSVVFETGFTWQQTSLVSSYRLVWFQPPRHLNRMKASSSSWAHRRHRHLETKIAKFNWCSNWLLFVSF